MKNILKYFAVAFAALMMMSCGEEKPGIIDLYPRDLKFQSMPGSQQVVSRGQGFILDAIVINGKDVGNRSDLHGDLFLDAGWVSVVTPGFSSNQLASRMIVKVKGNSSKSSRECEILVHNGSERKKVKLTQEAAPEPEK